MIATAKTGRLGEKVTCNNSQGETKIGGKGGQEECDN